MIRQIILKSLDLVDLVIIGGVDGTGLLNKHKQIALKIVIYALLSQLKKIWSTQH